MIRASLLLFGLLMLASGRSYAQQDAGPSPGGSAQVVPPKLLSEQKATYPAKALTDRIAARVIVELVISDKGEIDSANVTGTALYDEAGEGIESQDTYGFGDAALAAAFALRFAPAMTNGTPVSVSISYTFHFTLPAKSSPPTPESKTPIPPPAKAAAVNFRGKLLERGTRAILPGVVVTVFRGEGKDAVGFEATSNENGGFTFFDLAPGVWNVRVTPSGYHPYETTEQIVTGEVVEATYFVERRSYNPYDVLVKATRPKKEVNRRTLPAAEIATVPGTLGDPILVVENLPGVARSQLGSGEIIVRGSGPLDTGVFVDGIGVPLIYHFGGLKSVLPASVVESIDFYPGNFSVQYGRALGGVFDAHIKRLMPDRHHGSADISLLDTSVYLEFPLGDRGGIAFAARRSYVDFILNAVIPEDSDIGLINAPRYYDYQVLGNWRPRPAHDLRFLFLGSDDRIKLLFEDPADEVGIGPSSGNASATTFFQRFMAEYRYVPGPKFQNMLKLSIGRDVIDFDVFGDFRLDILVWQMQAREMATWTLADNVKLNVGLDALFTITDGDVRAPLIPTEGEEEPDFEPDDFLTSRFNNRLGLSAAPFVEAELTFGPVRLVPGIRMDYFSVADTVTFDPRLIARYQIGDWAIKAGVGIVHQEAPIYETDEVFGNPDLEVQNGIQYSAGVEWAPREYLTLEATAFYKDLDNLVARTNELIMRDGELVPKVLDNGRDGRVYGAEVYIRHKFANNFRGWLSYTLSRAERFERGSSEARLFDYDQTHILAMVASYRLPRNWEVGLRWRVVSGSPDTPVVDSVFVDQIDSYLPVLGETNSDRLPTFHQLDLRVDKTWVFQQWRLSAYLSLINAYNRKNIEDLSYSFDFREKGGSSGLPILPILGVKGEW